MKLQTHLNPPILVLDLAGLNAPMNERPRQHLRQVTERLLAPQSSGNESQGHFRVLGPWNGSQAQPFEIAFSATRTQGFAIA